MSCHLLVGYELEDGARYEAQYEHPYEQLTPASRVIRSTALADGSQHELAYQGRHTWVRDALGRVSVYEHDAREDIVSVRDPLGHITRTPFDANGHPKGSEDALGRSTSTVYDARGNITQIIDASGAKTQLRYNPLDLPVLLTAHWIAALANAHVCLPQARQGALDIGGLMVQVCKTERARCTHKTPAHTIILRRR